MRSELIHHEVKSQILERGLDLNGPRFEIQPEEFTIMDRHPIELFIRDCKMNLMLNP